MKVRRILVECALCGYHVAVPPEMRLDSVVAADAIRREIAEAIEKIIDNPALLAAYGKAGHERVESQFTVPIMIDNLEKHLKQKLAEKAGRR